MKNKITLVVLGWLFALLFPPGLKAIDVTNPSLSGWTPISIYDIAGDNYVGSGTGSVDIVGNSTYPSVYRQFTASGDSMAIRIRVNDCDGSPSSPEFHGFAYIGIDANLNGSIDFFIGAYNPTGAGRLGIYPADPAANNTSPEMTGIAKPIVTFQPLNGVNYSVLATTDGSNFSSNSDYFITFKFCVADISAAIAGQTKENVTFTPSTPFTFFAGTSVRDDVMNYDVNGVDNKSTSFPNWFSPTLFVPPMSTDGKVWHVVTFDTNGGDVDALPPIVAVENGTGIDHFPARNPIKRNGWRFVGWSNISNEPAMPPAPPTPTNPFTLGTIINANITVFATWEYTGLIEDVDEHIVHFNPSGGSWAGSVTYQDVLSDDGSIKTMPPNPNPPTVNPGGSTWVFGGWVMDSKLYNVSGQTSGMYNVVLISGNVQLYEDAVINYYIGGQAVTTLTKAYQSHSGEDEYTVYALWLSKANNISVQLNFIDNIYDNITVMQYGTQLYTEYVGNNDSPSMAPAPLSRQGYVFRGWDTNPNALPNAGGATRYLDPLNPSVLNNTTDGWLVCKFTSTTTFYAVWEPTDYALQFVPNTIDYVLNPLVGAPSGTFGYVLCPVNSSGIIYPNFPSPPTLFSYNFVGWNTEPDGSGFFVDEYGAGLTINAGDPMRFALINFDVGTVTLANGSSAYLGGYTTLYALWERDPNAHIDWTVTFDAMGGEHIMGSPYYELSDPLEEHHLLDVPATDGYLQYMPIPEWPEVDDDNEPLYVFAGWSFSDGPSRTVADPKVYSWLSDLRLLDQDTTLYAVWIPVNTVIFHPMGGEWEDSSTSSIKVATDDDGFALYVPGYYGDPDNHPLRTNYDFLGWNTEPDGTGTAYHRDTPVSGILNVFAQWLWINGPDPELYTDIIYDLNDGSGEQFSDLGVESGTLVTPPADPVRKGWRFKGWFTESACITQWDFAVDVAEGDYIILYAKWTEGRDYIIINHHLTLPLGK